MKDPKRIYTPAAYKEEFGRELEDDKLEAKWIFAKGRWVWGTLVRRNKEGVLDVSDNDVEEIEERSVIDDGHDLVRAGQLEAKYQHACQSFTDFSGTAATVADAALPDLGAANAASAAIGHSRCRRETGGRCQGLPA